MPLSRARRAVGALSLAAALPAAPSVARAVPAPGPAARSLSTPPPVARELEPPVVGVVRDTTGAPLPNVQVVISGLNRVTTTDDRGEFTFRGLPAGRYHLDAVLIGYARADADVVVPLTGEPVRVTIVLRATPMRLANVVVSASPTGGDPLRLAQSTVELSGRELGRSLGASVAQTLANEPGMAMRYNGPAANAPVIRGLSGERVLVLQDGQRSGDLASTSPDHGVSIDPLTASRIEVVRGPASLLYGTNALGGVVNVVSNDIPTEIPGHTSGYVATQGESATPGGALTASVTHPLSANVALSARGGFRRAEDLYTGGRLRLPNSFNRNVNGVVSAGFAGEQLRGGIGYRGYGFDYGLPSLDEAAHIRGRRNEAFGRAEFNVPGAAFLRFVRADASAQWYGHDEVEDTGEIATSFDLRTQTANVTAKTRAGQLEGAIGVSGLFRQYAAAGEEALTPAANTTNAGLFVYQEFPVGEGDEHGADDHSLGVRLQVGGRVDLLRIAPRAGDPTFGAPRTLDFNAASGSVGLNATLAERVTLGISAARSFRAPTVEELFSNAFHAAAGTFDIGNPNLRAETNQGVDAVLRAERGRVTGQLSTYYNGISNYIAPSIVGDTVVDEDVTVPVNRFGQADARLYGAEGRVEAAVAPRFILGALGDVVRGEFVGGGALPFMPPARLGALARWDNGRFSADTEVRRGFAQTRTSQSACGRAGGEVGESEPGTAVPCVDLPTGAYTLVNVSASLNLIRGPLVHSLTLRADNLLDESYYDATSRIKSFARNPGRNLSLVYRVLF